VKQIIAKDIDYVQESSKYLDGSPHSGEPMVRGETLWACPKCKEMITGVESGLIGTCYSISCEDIELWHLEFLTKILQLINEADTKALEDG